MKRVSTVLVALVFGFSVTSLLADPVKIGVVDLQKVIQTSNQMKVIQQKLEKEFKPRRDKLMEVETSLKEDMAKFERDRTVMSSTQKKDLEKKIVATQQQFERDGHQYQQELSTAHNEAMESLYSKVRSTISKIAQEEKYDLIIQKDAAPYSAEILDITQKVVKTVN